MKFLKNIGRAVEGAVSFVGEKNRKAAYLNRIRTVIRCGERAAEREYLALGRYYYNNLRDKSNPVTEAHCAELDTVGEQLERALDQLEQFYRANAGEQSASVDIISGEDGPAAVCFHGGKKEAEEITLDDVESFDYDPLSGASGAASEAPAGTAPAGTAPAELGENDGLPFEG